MGVDVLSVTLSGNITLDGASTATTLILTGNASALEYQHVLRTLDLQHDNNEPGPGLDTRTLQFEVSDARGGNATETLNVAVTSEAPVLSLGNSATVFVDGSGLDHVIAPNLSVSDVDDPSVAGVLIQLTGFSDDRLNLDASDLVGTEIVIVSQTADEIRLDGVADLSVYEGVLRQISLNNGSSDVPGGARQIDFTVFDRDSNDASNVSSFTVDVNNHPVLNPNTTPVVSGNDVSVSQVQLLDAAQLSEITKTLSLSDADGDEIAQVVVDLVNPVGIDELSVTLSGNITLDGTSTATTLILTGNASASEYQQVLRTLDLQHNNNEPGPGLGFRILQFEVSDTRGGNTTESLTIQVTNAPPELAGGNRVELLDKEMASGHVIADNITISDTDDPSVKGALVELTGMMVSDALVFDSNELTGTGITLKSSSSTLLEFEGVASLDDYQSVLRVIQIQNTGSNILGGDRVINFRTFDRDSGQASNQESYIVNINREPILDPNVNGDDVIVSQQQLLDNSLRSNVTNNLVLQEPDGDLISRVNIKLRDNLPGDELTIDLGHGITLGSGTSATRIVLRGDATAEQYQDVLRTLDITHNDNEPGPGLTPRRIQFDVTDDRGVSVREILNVTISDEDPVLTGGRSSVILVEDISVGYQVIDAIAISDVDDQSVSGALVTFDGLNGDSLQLDSSVLTGLGITIESIDSTAIRLTGIASSEHYKTALEAIMLKNDNSDVDGGDRTLDVVVFDRETGDASNTINFVVNVNQSPIIDPNTDPNAVGNDVSVSQVQLLDDTQISHVAQTLTLSDPEGDLIKMVTVTLDNAIQSDQLMIALDHGIILDQASTDTTLILTGEATAAHYQDVLRSLDLRHANNEPGPGLTSRQLTFDVLDARGGSSSETLTILVTDEDPEITESKLISVPFDDLVNGVVVAPQLDISDVDDPSISGARVTLTGVTGDRLEFSGVIPADSSIVITSQTDTIIRFGGVDTLAQYEAILESIRIIGTNQSVDVSDRMVEFVVFDRETQDVSQPVIMTLRPNTNPVLDPNTDPEAAGNDVSVSQVQLLDAAQLSEITKTLSLSDADGDEITQVVVELINPVGIDALSVTLSGNITLDGASTTTSLILTGNASASEYQQVLRTLDLQHDNNEPGPGLDTRTLQFEVSDARGGHTTDTLTVTVTNEAPVLSPGANANIFADALSAGHVIAPNLSVSDVDDPSVSGALIQLTGLTDDHLNLDTSLLTGTGITILSQTVNEIRLDGVADRSVYEGVLRQISVSNDSSDVPGGSRQVDFIVFDRDSNDMSNISSVTIDVNNHPAFDPNTDPAVDGNDVSVSQVQLLDTAQLSEITKTLSLSDVDGDEITQVVVELINPVGIDALSVTLSGNITLNGASTATSLILTGNASASEYQQVLRTLDLQHDNNEPGPGLDTRTLQFEVSDARGGNTTDTLTVTVTNEAPVLSSGANANIFADALSAGHVIAPNLSVSDVDDPSVSGALIQLTGLTDDHLNLDTSLLTGTGITILSQTVNEIRLDGVADRSVYEGVLRQISVSNDSSDVPGGSRQVDFIVFDRDSNDVSNISSVTIDVNNHPAFDPNTDPAVDGNDVSVSQVQLLDTAQLSEITKTLSLSDVDGDEITQVVVELINPVGIDALSVTLSGNITLDGASTTTSLILTGNASASEYQQVLRTLDLQHDNNEPGPGLDIRTLQFEVSDARGGNTTDTLTVTVTNEAPVLSPGANANIFADALSVGQVIAPSLSVSDVDDPSVSGALIQLTGLLGDSLVLDASLLAGTSVTVVSQTANEIRLSGVDELIVYETILRHIKLVNHLEIIPGGQRMTEFNVLDRESNNVSNTSVFMMDVNSNPVFDPNTDPTVDSNNVTITQVDLLNAFNQSTITSTLTLSDADGDEITQVVIELTNPVFGDVLHIDLGGNIILDQASTDTTLILTGNALALEYQEALRSLDLQHLDNEPGPGLTDRNVHFEVSDARGGNTTGTLVIEILDQDPFAFGGSMVTIEDTVLKAGHDVVDQIFISDADDPSLSGATITLSTGFAGDNISIDLSALNGTNITILSQTDTTIVLQGIDEFLNYELVLGEIMLSNTATGPIAAGKRVVDVSVIDRENGNSSGTVSFSVDVESTNVSVAPLLDTDQSDGPLEVNSSRTLLINNNGQDLIADLIAPELVVTDSQDDVDSIGSASVRLGNAESGDQLALNDELFELRSTSDGDQIFRKISGGPSENTGVTMRTVSDGVINFTGVAQSSVYTLILRGIEFRNSSDNPTTNDRTVTFDVADIDGLMSNLGVVTVSFNSGPITPIELGDEFVSEGRTKTLVTSEEMNAAFVDLEGDQLQFAIHQVRQVNLSDSTDSRTIDVPEWLRITDNHGVLSVGHAKRPVPEDRDVSPGGYRYEITIQATDVANGTTATQTILLEVRNTNDAPELPDYQDHSFSEGESIGFRLVTASDDDLTQTIFGPNADPSESITYRFAFVGSNGQEAPLPDWLNIDQTLQVSGTAPSVDADTSYTIRVFASDGDVEVSKDFVLLVQNEEQQEPPFLDTDETDGSVEIDSVTEMEIQTLLGENQLFNESQIEDLYQRDGNGRNDGISGDGAPLVTIQFDHEINVSYGSTSVEVIEITSTNHTQRAMGFYKVTESESGGISSVSDAYIIWGGVHFSGDNILLRSGSSETISLMELNPNLQIGDTIGFFFLDDLGNRTYADGTRVEFSTLKNGDLSSSNRLHILDDNGDRTGSVIDRGSISHASSQEMNIPLQNGKDMTLAGVPSRSNSEIIFGYEDNPNRDGQDYNDFVFTLQIGAENMRQFDPSIIAPNLQVDDPDGDVLASADVEMTVHSVGDELALDDVMFTATKSGAVLRVLDNGATRDTGIDIVFSDNGTHISLTGVASEELYQSVLRSVKLTSTKDFPPSDDRQVTFRATDQDGHQSELGTVTIDITNDNNSEHSCSNIQFANVFDGRHNGTSDNDDMSGKTSMYGRSGDDRLTGVVDQKNHLYGENGDDVLIGGNRGDAIRGGNDNDCIHGNDGKDWIRGGDGNDLILGGNGGDALLRGDSGDDRIYGGAGDDWAMYGNQGDDILNGGDGFDYLSGGDGDDYLVGGRGADIVGGGSGDNVYAFETLQDSIKTGRNALNWDADNQRYGSKWHPGDDKAGITKDVIRSFDEDDDKIDLSMIGIESMSELDISYDGKFWVVEHRESDFGFDIQDSRRDFDITEDIFIFA